MKKVDYCPGNMTRYKLYYEKIEDEWMVTWMDRGGGGVTIMFDARIPPYYVYIMEKMGVNEGDAKALAEFMKGLVEKEEM